jgi:chromosome segregation ATPase
MTEEVKAAGDIAQWAVGIPSVGVVIAYGVSIIRGRINKDLKEAGEDKSYTNMLETYKKERDEIKEERDRTMSRMAIVEAERNEAVSQVGKLSAEVTFLSVQVNELKVLVEKLGLSLELSRTEMQKVAIENAKLSAHVTYLEEIVEQRKTPREPHSRKPKSDQ